VPKRTDVEKVLVIGSGPIVIGQAAEFDFSGSQACRALREEGVSVVLVNSNPATIQTDPEMADAVYIEPVIPKVIERIIEKERPDGLLAGLGGQTALNITSELFDMGVFERYGVELLGTPLEAIRNSEDRQCFKDTMNSIGEPLPESRTVNSMEQARKVVREIGLPLIVRPAYTLGGFGSGIAHTNEELERIVHAGLHRSRIKQVLLEESVEGWKEFEYEVMRDARNTCITVCNMENLDAMGVHTGESIVVTPAQTLSDAEHQVLRSAALKIIRALKIEGGCNIQFAVRGGEYRVIEVNPRVSRSSALASKATGYPIARVAAKIALGLTLDEISNDVTRETPASFEPTVDYVVTKVPLWPFDKFPGADDTLTTSMKSTGEVMAIGRTIEESLQKALLSLDILESWGHGEKWDDARLEELLRRPTHKRLFAIYEALSRGWEIRRVDELTEWDPFFLQKLANIVEQSGTFRLDERDGARLRHLKRMGFSDARLALMTGRKEEDVRRRRGELGVNVTYKMVDTCAAEFEAKTPYYYSTYETEDENEPSERRKVLILGAGPIRIGQGIEFDYCTVHAVQALREEGVEAMIINNNPETVSTDYDTSDKLFFEPITLEHVLNVIESERPEGVMVQFGGQTSVNLAIPLQRALDARPELPTRILGTSPEGMDLAEDRELFSKVLAELEIPQAQSGYATSFEQAREEAGKIGYPVLVRPSYVLGGRAMEIIYDEYDLERYMEEAVRVSSEHPVLIDRFLENAVEIDVDAVCDGKDVLIGAIMEHIEEAGIHSGDSSCVIPPQGISQEVQDTVRDYVRRIALRLGVVGLLNIQLAFRRGRVYVLEANPRSSRTIPFVSKATGVPLAKLAAKVMLGHTLEELGCTEEPRPRFTSVKEVVLPFDKLPGADPLLGPEMRSTGEVMGIDRNFDLAFFKAALAASNTLPTSGTVFISVNNADKPKMVPQVKEMAAMGLKLVGTSGTAEYMSKHGVNVERLQKIYEGHPNVVDLMEKDEVNLIINTPTAYLARRDGYDIRRNAVDYGVPYLTTVQAAHAAVKAMRAMREGEFEVRSLQEYLGLSGG